MNKTQIKAALHSNMILKIANSRRTIEAMSGQASNPQVALMIEKNKGYIMALDDIGDLLSSRSIF
jgi:hypothetical protein